MLDMSFLEEMKSWINKEGLVFDEPRIDELRSLPSLPDSSPDIKPFFEGQVKAVGISCDGYDTG